MCEGGDGGGVVFIMADTLLGTGDVHANGTDGEDSSDDDGANGGGAGGTIWITVNDASTYSGTLSASGGNGGSKLGGTIPQHGPGGGGGGGFIYSSDNVGALGTVGAGSPGDSNQGNRGATAGTQGVLDPNLPLPGS